MSKVSGDNPETSEDTDSLGDFSEFEDYFGDYDDFESDPSKEAAGSDKGDESDESDEGADDEADDESDGDGDYGEDHGVHEGVGAPPTRIIKIVSPDEWITSDFMTVCECARAIALRAQQIADGGHVYTDCAAGITDAKAMARKELLDNKSPLTLWRYVGESDGMKTYEKRAVRDMAYALSTVT